MVAGLINPIPLIAERLEISALSHFPPVSRTFPMRSLGEDKRDVLQPLQCDKSAEKTSGWRTFGRATKDEERMAT